MIIRKHLSIQTIVLHITCSLVFVQFPPSNINMEQRFWFWCRHLSMLMSLNGDRHPTVNSWKKIEIKMMKQTYRNAFQANDSYIYIWIFLFSLTIWYSRHFESVQHRNKTTSIHSKDSYKLLDAWQKVKYALKIFIQFICVFSFINKIKTKRAFIFD